MTEVSKEEFVEFLNNYKNHVDSGFYGMSYIYSDYSLTLSSNNEWPNCMIACHVPKNGLMSEKFYIRKD